MTKEVNWLPNLRVDVPDMKAGTNELATGVRGQLAEQFLIDDFSRIAAGFRVEIANQVTSPGQFTVYNGFGFDRDGKVVENEDEENTSRSLTLIADGQYFVEVIWRQDEANTDARGFWDPTVDNGTDPSGDPRLPGREFAQNTATRLAPDWQLVQPVSTTGFQSTTNANSVRIPVAVIQVAGGVIVGATTVPARTNLEESVGGGVSRIKVVDSRLFPDVFTANLGAEAITINSNDRRNGILTLGVALAGAHEAGERLVQTGGGLLQFLTDRADQAIPAAGTSDARPRFFQGFEERGRVMSQDPNAAGGRSATNVESLKDYVDFIAAQVREIRFGAERSVDVGKIGPPMAFPALPYHYDLAGGVAGARTNTISIGNGVDTFGDFNVLQMGTFEAAFNAAMALLPSTGGTIYLKGGPTTYVAATGVTVNKQVVIVGDGPSTKILATGANPAFTVALPLAFPSCAFRDLYVARDAAAAAVSAMALTGTRTLALTNCFIEGLTSSSNGKVIATNCLFTAISGAGSNNIALRGSYSGSTFMACGFLSNIAAAGARAVLLDGALSFQTEFLNCQFQANATATSQVEIADATVAFQVRFNHCFFGGTGTIRLRVGTNVANEQVMVRDCSFSGGDGITGLFVGAAIDSHVEGCKFGDITTAMQLVDVTRMTVSNCEHINTTAGRGRKGILVTGLIKDSLITGCKFEGLSDVAGAETAGIHINNPGTVNNLTISQCSFISIGTTAGTVPARGIYGSPAAGGANLVELAIINCYFASISTAAASNARGIDLTDGAGIARILGNSMFAIGLTSNNAAGIVVSGGVAIIINNNQISGVGLTGNAQINGIWVKTASVGVTSNISISNNVMRGLSSTAFVDGSAGILIDDVGDSISIIGNNINASGVNIDGIYARATAGASTLTDLAINDNLVGSAESNAIHRGVIVNLLLGPAPATSGRFQVNNNKVRGCTTTGIQVTGSAHFTFQIVGNIVRSLNLTPIGVSLIGLVFFNFTGNVIDLSEGTANGKIALAITDCERSLIVGNHISVGNIGLRCIAIDISDRINLNGNFISSQTPTANAAVDLFNTTTNVYFFGNFLFGFTAFHFQNLGGGGNWYKAIDEAAGATNIPAANPANVNQIGTNWRE